MNKVYKTLDNYHQQSKWITNQNNLMVVVHHIVLVDTTLYYLLYYCPRKVHVRQRIVTISYVSWEIHTTINDCLWLCARFYAPIHYRCG